MYERLWVSHIFPAPLLCVCVCKGLTWVREQTSLISVPSISCTLLAAESLMCIYCFCFFPLLILICWCQLVCLVVSWFHFPHVLLFSSVNLFFLIFVFYLCQLSPGSFQSLNPHSFSTFPFHLALLLDLVFRLVIRLRSICLEAWIWLCEFRQISGFCA